MFIKHLSIIISVMALASCVNTKPSSSYDGELINATYAYNTISNGRLKNFENTCPLNGEKFTATSWLSGTSTGLQLDLKKLGRFPQPLILPVCPTNKFIIYQKKFSEQEIIKLNKIVNSPEYIAIRDSETDYFRLAHIYKKIDKKDLYLADAYLKATWQLHDGDNRYKKYAKEAIKHFKNVLKSDKEFDYIKQSANIQKTPYSTNTINILIGELYRRSEQFELAEKHFSALLQDKIMIERYPMDFKLIKFSKELANKKDAARYNVKGMMVSKKKNNANSKS